jgi:hypothetical protein
MNELRTPNKRNGVDEGQKLHEDPGKQSPSKPSCRLDRPPSQSPSPFKMPVRSTFTYWSRVIVDMNMDERGWGEIWEDVEKENKDGLGGLGWMTLARTTRSSASTALCSFPLHLGYRAYAWNMIP